MLPLIRLRRNSDLGNYDRAVVQEVLKDIAQTQQVDLNARKRFKGELQDRLSVTLSALDP